ncbi:glycosyltransferase family A protein [Nocardioides sp. AE5]|uniref:glycosyltransferase family A protein n=1 Tax=Nocardioides sp. AE5 TaxID=2962573 RepID=UPI002881B40C|nr:glycosyltransferase family A protein [Nocardioides sp. AE5]MDT0202068.1 glycosyltransferase family A protein [Nocardioides sp. AE5]
MPKPTLPAMAWPTLARTAGRLPGSRYRDDLARQASRGHFDADGLIAHARTGTTGIAVDFDPVGLAWFGHFVASEHESGTNVEDTVAVFRLAYRVGGHRALSGDLNAVWVQALSLAGQLGAFRSVLTPRRVNSSVLWAADADALHPGSPTTADAAWLAELNRPFAALGIEPLGLRGGEGVAFDRVYAAATADDPDPDLPLVSVIVPVYNPGPSLRTTVDSLLAQTWSNLEILLCDDASTTGSELFAELVALDARIHHVRAPRNGGAYAARNLGVGTARGEFVTFNDADDWSHPRRIERQYRAMQATPGARACMSWCIQCTPDLRLTVLGRPTERVNLSSILFRRSDVLAGMGGFDAIRKGADSEFVERFRVRFGKEALLEIEEPLALVQLTQGSLSRDDFRFLRTNPTRRQYMSDFRHWHAQLRRAPEGAYVAPGVRAPFPAPDYLAGVRPAPRDLDVVLLANLTAGAPTVVDLAAEATALVDAGLRVGIMECLAPYDLTASVREARGSLAEAIRNGVTRLFPGDQVRARLLVVRDPAGPVAMPDQALTGLTAPHAVVIADYAPHHGGGYDPAAVADILASRTGAAVAWLPATPGIGTAIAESAIPARVLPPAPFGALESRPGVPAAAVPTVGIALDDPTPVTGTDTGLAPFLEATSDSEIRVLSRGPGRTSGLEALGVEHLRSTAVSDDEFAALCDIIVIPRLPQRGPHLSRWLARALANGRIIVAPRAYEGHLDTAALYLDETDLAQLALAWESAMVAAQGRRAADWAMSHLGAEAVRSAIIPHLTSSKETVDA